MKYLIAWILGVPIGILVIIWIIFHVITDISRTKKELFAIKGVGVADIESGRWIV